MREMGHTTISRFHLHQVLTNHQLFFFQSLIFQNQCIYQLVLFLILKIKFWKSYSYLYRKSWIIKWNLDNHSNYFCVICYIYMFMPLTNCQKMNITVKRWITDHAFELDDFMLHSHHYGHLLLVNLCGLLFPEV